MFVTTLNDSYEPTKTRQNMQKNIKKKNEQFTAKIIKYAKICIFRFHTITILIDLFHTPLYFTINNKDIQIL